VTKGHKYCVLDVMSSWEADTWRAVAITCFDVVDMAIGYVACGGITHCDVGDMAMEYVETKVEPKRGIAIRGISIHGSR
jgi:hypothetical protein